MTNSYIKKTEYYVDNELLMTSDERDIPTEEILNANREGVKWTLQMLKLKGIIDMFKIITTEEHK